MNLTRRAVLRAGCGAAVSQLASAQAGRPRVLALIGDRYHNADYIRVALTRIYDGLNVTLDYTIDYQRLSHGTLKNYQCFL